MKYLSVVSLSFFFLCCGTLQSTAQQYDGSWESLGYGRLLTIKGQRYEIKDVTGLSCLPALAGNLSELTDTLALMNDTLALGNGINTYYFIRSDKPLCEATSKAPKKDPVFNFEVLAETFREHYAYFRERDIDWAALYQKYRSRISPNTPPEELFHLMGQMLDEFGDGHIQLSAPEKVEAKAAKLAEKADNTPPEKAIPGWKLAQEVAEKMFDTLKSKRGGTVRWGVFKDAIGYIQINQMIGLGDYGVDDQASVPEFWKAYIPIMAGKNALELTNGERNGMASIMDEVMRDLDATRGIILDVRFNGGGKDEVGLEVLRRFNATKKQVATKKAFMNNGYSPEVPIYVEGAARPYEHPVCLLTSRATASASEIFVLASLSMPNMQRIGGQTEGIFSDMLDKNLPNGWEFSLSNEIYEDMRGTNYEHIGIEPDWVVYEGRTRNEQYRAIRQDLENNRDAALSRAYEVLTTRIN